MRQGPQKSQKRVEKLWELPESKETVVDLCLLLMICTGCHSFLLLFLVYVGQRQILYRSGKSAQS